MPFFFFQAEDGIRGADVTGVQTCALPISSSISPRASAPWARSRMWASVPAKTSESVKRQTRGSRMVEAMRAFSRSEERRVGKEGRSRWLGSEEKKSCEEVDVQTYDVGYRW